MESMDGKKRQLHARGEHDSFVYRGPTASVHDDLVVTESGCKCKERWVSDGVGVDEEPTECLTHCCNPGGKRFRNWCEVEDPSCEGESWGFCMASGHGSGSGYGDGSGLTVPIGRSFTDDMYLSSMLEKGKKEALYSSVHLCMMLATEDFSAAFCYHQGAAHPSLWAPCLQRASQLDVQLKCDECGLYPRSQVLNYDMYDGYTTFPASQCLRLLEGSSGGFCSIQHCAKWNTFPGLTFQARTERAKDKKFCLQTARNTGRVDSRAYMSMVDDRPVAGVCNDCIFLAETVELQKQCLMAAERDCTESDCESMLHGAKAMCRKFMQREALMTMCEPWEYRVDGLNCVAKTCKNANAPLAKALAGEREPARCGVGATCKTIDDRMKFEDAYGFEGGTSTNPPTDYSTDTFTDTLTDALRPINGATRDCEEFKRCGPFGYTCECDEDGYYGATSVNKAAVCREYTCENGGGGKPFDCGPGATCSNDGAGSNAGAGVHCHCPNGVVFQNKACAGLRPLSNGYPESWVEDSHQTVPPSDTPSSDIPQAGVHCVGHWGCECVAGATGYEYTNIFGIVTAQEGSGAQCNFADGDTSDGCALGCDNLPNTHAGDDDCTIMQWFGATCAQIVAAGKCDNKLYNSLCARSCESCLTTCDDNDALMLFWSKYMDSNGHTGFPTTCAGGLIAAPVGTAHAGRVGMEYGQTYAHACPSASGKCGKKTRKRKLTESMFKMHDAQFMESFSN